MSNIISYITCFGFIPWFLMGLLGLILGYLLWGRSRHEGDLTLEGEGALRAESDGLRARVQELEGRISTRDTEVSGLKTKLAAAAAGAATVGVATAAATSADSDSDETYALEWRNRYLAARVKYLESRLTETPKAKKPAAKAKAKKTPAAKAVPAPKVLYTEGPTDGTPDDLKLIKGIGPKFEGDLNSKGIYYFRQIGAWKAADVKMVEGVIDSIPGRIKRDEWVRQAKGLAKSGGVKATAKKKSGSKSTTSKSSLAATGATRKKSGPKPGSKRVAKPQITDAEAALEKYFANVKKFDANADKAVVKKIVSYCGVALRSRDSSLVACSDETEVKTVANGFCTKKLGMTSGQMELVKDVCVQMKPERFKNRVTFYYLAAKKAGKLSIFGG